MGIGYVISLRVTCISERRKGPIKGRGHNFLHILSLHLVNSGSISAFFLRLISHRRSSRLILALRELFFYAAVDRLVSNSHRCDVKKKKQTNFFFKILKTDQFHQHKHLNKSARNRNFQTGFSPQESPDSGLQF